LVEGKLVFVTRLPEKVTFTILKVTFSDERMTFTILKVTFSGLKVVFSCIDIRIIMHFCMKRKVKFSFAFCSTFRNSVLIRARRYSVSAKKKNKFFCFALDFSYLCQQKPWSYETHLATDLWTLVDGGDHYSTVDTSPSTDDIAWDGDFGTDDTDCG
jgi:hypothetical protein